jgi:hypothetical protein
MVHEKQKERTMKKLITIITMMAVLAMASAGMAQLRSSVAEVFVEDYGQGKGFFVTRSLIVTCKHVIAKKYDPKTNTFSNFTSEVIVKHGLIKIRAEVVDVHPVYDLALLEVKGKGPKPFKLCGADWSKDVTMWTFEFGRFKYKKGKIRDESGAFITVGLTPVNGNSGSPLVQGTWRDKCAVGITESTYPATGEGVFISGFLIKEFLNDYLESVE